MLQNFRLNIENLFNYLNNLETAFNLHEPEIQAFVPEENRFTRLHAEADALFLKFPDPDSRPKLFGLLVGVKDIFYVDGFQTRAGSKLPENEFRGEEAWVVSRLRQGGALVMGKTVTTEFAYFYPGPTRNPHNLMHTPGGSSSGSAAAVAAGLVPFATGTQTIGSISRPASYCGVAGYKPSHGRLSTQGVIPISPSLDQIGYFTEDARSAQFLAEFLIENWNRDYYQQRRPELGIPVGPFLENASDEMRGHFDETCRKLTLAGYSLKKVDVMAEFDEIMENHQKIVAAEAYKVHKDWYAKYSSLYHPATIELLMRGRSVGKNELKQALAGREKLRFELSRAAKVHDIDLWLSPAAIGSAPEGLDSTGDPIMNLPWTYSGLPTLCINTGKNHKGLPLGLQIAGEWNQDEALLHWSNILEHELIRRTE